MTPLRPDWITKQLAEARQSFREAPAYLYHGSPLQDLKKQIDERPEQ